MTEPAEKCPTDAACQPADDRPPINAEWLTRMRSTKPEFLARLFEVFLADEPARIAALGEAVARGDLEQVRFQAHAIKGAAAVLGMERLCDAARALEHAAKDGGTDALAVQLARVQGEMGAVFAVMRSASPGT
ncbi:MAG: Hpt domain-containing protein [Humidesulfovibrio sp.]|nr:Hpt domain-containing protein [Humidesulfovibrio sp.]